MKAINIKDMDKAEVLRRLYNASWPQGLGWLQATGNEMTHAEALEIIDSGQTYFDYLRGRVMKVEISGDELDARWYDRDNGEGAAAAALEGLTVTA